jgi:3-phenylpropionate/trans-cinnamate dioxygenase ferredoxin reductase subunit
MTKSGGSLVIVGAGHAASELAITARQQGWAGAITILGDEPVPPYQRPPLSKAYLLGEVAAGDLGLRTPAAYDAAQIAIRCAARVVVLDRAVRAVTLADGSVLPYDKLAWCAGGRPRPLVCDGIDDRRPPSNILYLRSIADADRLRGAISPGGRIVVVGGGYVGLEVAASARKLGAEVTVIEAQKTLLARVAGPAVSAFYARVHRNAGVSILTDCSVLAVEVHGGAVTAVRCSDNRRLPADVVVVGIGMIANVDVPNAAGLGNETGIPVDDLSRTDDPDIVAAGDCTMQLHPLYDRPVRIESVPNALEQARAAASWLCGKPKPNRSVPWFWSDQYDLKLQMAGLSAGFDRCVVRGQVETGSFSAFYLHGPRLIAVDAINRPADFLMSRKLLAKPVLADAERLADDSVPLGAALTQAA